MSPYGSIPASQDDTGEMWPLAHSTDAPSMDRAIQHVNGTDTTSLLLAQNNNNHANANPHQGSTSTGSENDAIQLLPLLRRGTFHSFNEALEEHVTGRRVRSRTLGLLLAVAIGAAGLVLSSTLISQSRSASSEDDVAALKLFGYTQDPRPPFSTLDPVHDLGLYDFNRPKSSKPSQVITFTKPSKKSYPTNTWYQSLLMVGSDEEPTVTHRAYAIPYVLDAAGPVPGLRVHPNHIDASSSVVQLYVIEEYGLTVGVAPLVAAAVTKSGSNQTVTHRYKVTHTTPIGLTLAWDSFPMESSIAKGMPYTTMRYKSIHQKGGDNGDALFPTVAAEVLLAKAPVADKTTTVECTSAGSKLKPFMVERDVEVFFKRSDFTWLIFVSEPVQMQCVLDENEMMRLQIVDWKEDSNVERELVVRVALSKKCTSGVNPIYCHQEKLHPTALMLGQGHYDVQLRTHANYFPGPNSTFNFYFENETAAVMVFDWDMQDMSKIALHPLPTNGSELSMIGFALPHHFDSIVQQPPADHDIYCVATLTGPACLYEGPVWEVREQIPDIGLRAPRPPAPWAMASIATSLKHDINYTLPSFYRRGAGDTYFSGKMLAKLGRILLVAEEMNELCSNSKDSAYKTACQGIVLPSKEEMSKAVASLRSGVEIWINGTAEIPFVYDSSWGGVVSCGCDFDGDKEICKNKYPKCTGFQDPGLNFGNAFYNDMHFHYGYFIFGAAVVAHFDPEWGRQTFEEVLLLIRCIANPSEEDEYFPTWRHKDWYQGHSWASGIAVVVLNGKNQESSSESIAAYEAIALYGHEMVSAWKQNGSLLKAQIALEIEQSGKLLTATELKSARTYWHVTNDDKIKIYPSSYTPRTIGILWQTMAQCQTWFGSAAYLAYGIQLLPITPISEYRDTVSWTKEMYRIFASTCSSDPECTNDGWSVIQLALLSVVGHQQESSDMAMELPAEVFESSGGNGHSLTNTLWYISTRPTVDIPLPLSKADISAASSARKNVNSTAAKATQVTDCGKPGICTDYILDTIAGEYSCRQRMDWLVQQMGQTETEACSQIAGDENPFECGVCDPFADESNTTSYSGTPKCSQCTHEQCQSDLNRCPVFDATFVCTEGGSIGGCSRTPWDVPSQQCKECCELTQCVKASAAETRAQNEEYCQPCSSHHCRSHQCDVEKHGLQYLCLEGLSEGGCSLLPWAVKGIQCSKCCTVTPGCDHGS